MRKYYIKYQENTEVNYLYLLLLYKIAKLGRSHLLDTITFDSLSHLAQLLNEEYSKVNVSATSKAVSVSSLLRVLNSEANKEYFEYYKDNRTIILKNKFTKSTGNNKFVILNDSEVNFLLIQNDKLLTRYYLYIKSYCGYSGTNSTDFTANQFLEALNYSTKSGSNKAKLSSFNSLLSSNGFIRIDKFRSNGKERNRYYLLAPASK